MALFPKIGETDFNFPKKFVFSVALFSFFMLVVPLGVYLVSQQTNLTPQAKVTKPSNLPNVMSLIRSEPKNGQIEVLWEVSPQSEEANLITAEITFPSDILEVKSINTKIDDKLEKKWLRKDFDQAQGKIELAVGVPAPGLKTAAQQKQTLAKIVFKLNAEGTASIDFDNAHIFANSTNKDILSQKNNAQAIKILYKNVALLPKCEVRPACLDLEKPCKISEPKEGWCPKSANVSIKSPAGGEVYSFSEPIDIEWDLQGIDRVLLTLYLNDRILGKIASVGAEEGSFKWDPLKSIRPSLLNSSNTFRIGISDIPGDFEVISDPFSIVLEEGEQPLSRIEARKSVGQADLNRDGKVNYVDLSIILSEFGKKKPENDLNSDGVINEIDLWIFNSLLNQP
ncbi:hypothetical protein HYS97_02445 [Candidatus Daviesbacteria bacterium]|nr:hypothetical protein [Candidatus Daviesbacteria bacterium]